MTTPARALLIGGSAIRIAYGAGSLLDPQRMVSKRLAPDTHDLADPRLLLRAFGGHQIVTGALTLAATRSVALARLAAALSILIDTLDVLSALLELRARGGGDETIAGGIAISGSGIIAFASALFALGPR
jgi:hypothetical protein